MVVMSLQIAKCRNSSRTFNHHEPPATLLSSCAHAWWTAAILAAIRTALWLCSVGVRGRAQGRLLSACQGATGLAQVLPLWLGRRRNSSATSSNNESPRSQASSRRSRSLKPRFAPRKVATRGSPFYSAAKDLHSFRHSLPSVEALTALALSSLVAVAMIPSANSSSGSQV